MKRLIFLLAFLVLVPASPLFADNWRWVDDLGVVHFTNDEDVIPEQYRKSAQRVGAARTKTKEEKKAKTASLKYREYGKAMLVTILVNGLKRPFLYDPDSSSTVITHELESELELKKVPGSEAVAHMPDGSLLPIYLVELAKVQIGPIELTNVSAVVKDFDDESIDASGILGMNDLEDYEVGIDSETKTLTIKPLEQ